MSRLLSLFFWCRKVWIYPLLTLGFAVTLFLIPYSPREQLYFSEYLELIETKLSDEGTLSEDLEILFREIYEIERKEGVAILMDRDQTEFVHLLEDKYERLESLDSKLEPLGMAISYLSELKKELILWQYADANAIDLFSQGQSIFYLNIFLSIIQYGWVNWIFIILFVFHLHKRRACSSLAEYSFREVQNQGLISLVYYVFAFFLPFIMLVAVFVTYGWLSGLNPLLFPVILREGSGSEVIGFYDFIIRCFSYQTLGIVSIHQLIRLMVLLNWDWTLIVLGFATGWLPLILPIQSLLWSPFYLLQSFSVLSDFVESLSWQVALGGLGLYVLFFSLIIILMKKRTNLFYI